MHVIIYSMELTTKVKKYIDKIAKTKKIKLKDMTPEELRLYNNKRQKEYRAKRRNGYWVYYLPDYHYCGHTSDVKQRMYLHKQQGRDLAVDNYRILAHCETQKEAAYTEAMYHGVLAMEGLQSVRNK